MPQGSLCIAYNASMSKRKYRGDWQELLIMNVHESRQGFGAASRETVTGINRWNVRLISLGFVCLVSILVARLIYLQIFEGGQHNLLAASNHLEKIRQVAPRGIIYDRNGEALVKNVIKENGDSTREYVFGSVDSAFIGYIAEVREDEVGCDEGICNEPGMWTGRAGVEKVFENTLRGRDGGRLVELNASGQEVRELGTNVPEPGEDLNLSIDSRLQMIMARALGSRPGSAVAIDMQGKVLGLVSNPGYDPNLFTVHPDAPALKKLLTDSLTQNFLDRPISGNYPPGSVYKPVTAYAGLETGAINKDTLIDDTGEIKIDQYRYGNWYFDQYGRKEGEINVERALARSNDIFFYKVGEAVGVDKLVEYSRRFGYGSKTGIELPGESAGLVPDRLWKERATGEKWFLGNTYHMAIGQGDLQVTPVQVARMTAAAVSGRLCSLSLIKDAKVACEDLGLKEEDIATVREGLKGVCASGGTAFPFFDFSPWVMCKTGTAQHGAQIIDSETSTSNEIKPHAWMTVAYPGENPEMILTVMLESAGEGSYEAGPVAKQILSEWRDIKK